MRNRPFAFLLLALVVFVVSACGGPSVQPLSFRPAPWSAGEVSQYDLLNRNGNQVGTAMWSWERTANQWQQHYVVTVNNVPDQGTVVLGDDLKPIRSSREVGGKRFETSYGAKTVDITTTAADGTTSTKSVPAAADAIDNDASLQVQRALPLAPNYATQYTDIIPTTASAAPIVVSVTGAETVTVPAGTFATWHIKMSFSGAAHDGWYAQQPPYPMVKYQNGQSGAVFALRQLGIGAAPATSGAAAMPAAVATAVPTQATSAPRALPPVNVGLLLTTFVVQLPVMLGLPFLLGWYIRKRWRVSWGVFGIGALTFILSQVVHIPLNAALGLLGGQTHGVALWPLIPKGLVVGLSAAVCEEGARLLVITTFARHIRGWWNGLQYGAGHGGAESIIFGVFVLVSIVGIFASRSLGAASQALPSETAAQIQAAQASYWGQSPALPLVAAVERVFALAMHISLAVLVVTAITQRKPLYFVLAVLLHTLPDAWTIWGQDFGIAAIEAGAALAAVIGLWFVWRLREQPAAAAVVLSNEPSSKGTPTAPVTADDLTERQLSLEELARRAERSRYE